MVSIYEQKGENIMQILKLKTSNFKGVPLDIDFKGKSADIYGDNGTGKTTVADAVWWLLFNKNSNNDTKFDIKPIGKDGQEKHNAEYSVEAGFKLDNGTTVSLKKVLTEKWTRKRGSAVKENTGNETKYFIDGTPNTMNKFNAYIKETFVSEDIFQLLTNVHHFAENIDWKQRRELILNVCGDVAQDAVFQANPDIKELADLIGNKSINDFKATVEAQKASINSEIKIIPPKISELQSSICELESENQLQLESQRGTLKEQMEKLNKSIAELESGSNDINIKTRIASISLKIASERSKSINAMNDIREGQNKAIREARGKLEKQEMELRSQESFQKIISDSISNYEEAITSLAAEFDSIQSEVNDAISKYDNTQAETKCSLCGQPLSPDMVAKIKAEAEERLKKYLAQQSEKLDKINQKGKEIMEQQKKGKHTLTELKAKMDKVRGEMPKLQQAVEEAEKRAAEPQAVEKSEAQVKLELEKAELEKQLGKCEQNNNPEKDRLSAEVADTQKQLDEVEEKLADLRSAAKTKQRIKELMHQQQKYSQDYEELCRQLSLTEEFTKTRVQLLENNVSKKFKLAKFKMFHEQINGGLTECCEPMYDGKPYKALNTGLQYNIGLDIIRTLDKYYKFYPPVVIDNAESITRLDTDIDAQVIRLIVSEQDKKLRVVLK